MGYTVLLCTVLSLLVAKGYSQTTYKTLYDQPIAFSNITGSQKLPDEFDGRSYSLITFSEEPNGLYAGGRDILLEIGLPDMTVFQNIIDQKSGCTAEDTATCNFIRVVQPLETGSCLFVCGTDGGTPKCYIVNTTDWTKTDANATYSSDGAIPGEPEQSTIWIYSSTEGKLFTAISPTVQSDSVRWTDLATCRAPYVGVVATGLNEKTANTPEYVGDPIIKGGHIYFFYREYATEHINGGKIIYSRVARVCLNDPGGGLGSDFDGAFTTFQKARLDCSIKGSNTIVFAYNEIQDVYQLDDDRVLAVFTTPGGALPSSAVCAYSLVEIDDLFNAGNFRGPKDPEFLFMEPNTADVPDPRPFQCPSSDRTDYAFISNYQLMSTLVPNKLDYNTWTPLYTRPSDNPVHTQDDVRFVQIVVDPTFDVMFLGTDRGTVIKAYLNQSEAEVSLIEEIDFNMEGGPQVPILAMVRDDKAIYVGTENSIYKLPLERCSTRNNCTCALDPYCTWNGETCEGRKSPGSEGIRADCNAIPPVEIKIILTTDDVISVPPGNITHVVAIGYSSNVDDLSAIDCCSTCNCVNETQAKTVETCGDSKTVIVTVDLAIQLDNPCDCTISFTDGVISSSTVTTNIQLDDSQSVAGSDCIKNADDYDDDLSVYIYGKYLQTNCKVMDSPGIGICEGRLALPCQ